MSNNPVPTELKPTALRIVEQAARLFAKDGFDLITMRDIAQHCAIKAPSLYHHFSDKQSLYQAVLQQVFRQHNAELALVFNGDAPPQDKLFQVIVLSARKMQQDSVFRQLLWRELLSNNPQRMQFLAEEVMTQSCSQLQQILLQISPPNRRIDSHFAITSVLGLLVFHVQLGAMRSFLPGAEPQHNDVDYLAKQIFEMILAFT
ncbi:hypothetical protein THMIRHAS_06030 [Thiosulfatimonas sediminis]|uniref:HTH tetR-type domain-containing protein n=1 Tax=Thiosulfatimonas sediminis TaxID=2675054 RepID=A0A6F8PTB8_9GAMM|nr:TetR/AcrR family transcriptional regulator [Thiosulfatimonas sediminis]BBP45230.1 hypothetical protein THMIRHAS_06030 [Thiosulfatimonas sediminis]